MWCRESGDDQEMEVRLKMRCRSSLKAVSDVTASSNRGSMHSVPDFVGSGRGRRHAEAFSEIGVQLIRSTHYVIMVHQDLDGDLLEAATSPQTGTIHQSWPLHRCFLPINGPIV